MTSVFQRAIWTGTPREVAAQWVLRNRSRLAVCRMWTHAYGYELRLEVDDEFMASEVCRNNKAIVSCQKRWRDALEAEGWTKGWK